VKKKEKEMLESERRESEAKCEVRGGVGKSKVEGESYGGRMRSTSVRTTTMEKVYVRKEASDVCESGRARKGKCEEKRKQRRRKGRRVCTNVKAKAKDEGEDERERVRKSMKWGQERCERESEGRGRGEGVREQGGEGERDGCVRE
jgi:hypothetical protein